MSVRWNSRVFTSQMALAIDSGAALLPSPFPISHAFHLSSHSSFQGGGLSSSFWFPPLCWNWSCSRKKRLTTQWEGSWICKKGRCLFHFVLSYCSCLLQNLQTWVQTVLGWPFLFRGCICETSRIWYYILYGPQVKNMEVVLQVI